MAERKKEEPAIASEASSAVARVAPAEPISPQEFSELRELTNSLLQAVATLQTQDGRTREFQGLIDDVRAATRTIALAPAGTAAVVRPHDTGSEECGCGPCSCVSANCCLFEITMTHARVTEMQLEPVDSNALPGPKMELKFFASIDGVGGVYPSLWGETPFRKNLGQPGLWQSTRLKVGTVMVCKGQPKTFAIDLDVVEVDDGGLEATAARDEHGSNSASMTLDCCLAVPLICTIDVELNHGGLGRGAIEAKFEARKICC